MDILFFPNTLAYFTKACFIATPKVNGYIIFSNTLAYYTLAWFTTTPKVDGYIIFSKHTSLIY
jgi:hypothetical protein